MKAIDGDIIVVPLTLLYNAVLSFESVDKILKVTIQAFKSTFLSLLPAISVQCGIQFGV